MFASYLMVLMWLRYDPRISSKWAFLVDRLQEFQGIVPGAPECPFFLLTPTVCRRLLFQGLVQSSHSPVGLWMVVRGNVLFDLNNLIVPLDK